MKKYKIFFIGFVLCIFGLFITAIIHIIITVLINKDFSNFNRDDLTVNQINFFKIVLAAPIIEELGFRLFLKPKKNIFISISFTIILFYIIGFIFRDIDIYYNLAACLFFFLLSFFYVKKYKEIIKNHFSLFFYISAFLFAVLHLKAYNALSQIQLFLFPLIILPYFIYGIAFSYVRIKSNIFIAILLHMTINGIAFFLKYLSTLIKMTEN